MDSKKFTRTIEDFTCGNCGLEVKGNGYTNHCPKCLWSKHVDKNPGDRLEECGGLMKPIAIAKEGKDFVITHRCLRCGFERRKKVEEGDDFDAVIKISSSADDSATKK
ncbi:MAG TPA: RNHCP domain-containing protein [Candidatus Paceibacterota bacterium]